MQPPGASVDGTGERKIASQIAFGASDRRTRGCGRDTLRGARTERQPGCFGRVLGTLIAEGRLQTLVSELFRLQGVPRPVPGNEPLRRIQRAIFQVRLHSRQSNVGQAVAQRPEGSIGK
jgi:hypothetical protein